MRELLRTDGRAALILTEELAVRAIRAIEEG